MDETVKQFPAAYEEIIKNSNDIEFDQLSDPLLGSFLSTLTAAKPKGRFLADLIHKKLQEEIKVRAAVELQPGLFPDERSDERRLLRCLGR